MLRNPLDFRHFCNNGNLVSGDGLFRVYNSLNQLVKIYKGTSANDTLLQEYIHNPIEEKVAIKKTYNSTGQVIETMYYFDEDYIRVVNTTDDYTCEFIYLEGQQVAQESTGKITTYKMSESYKEYLLNMLCGKKLIPIRNGAIIKIELIRKKPNPLTL